MSNALDAIERAERAGTELRQLIREAHEALSDLRRALASLQRKYGTRLYEAGCRCEVCRQANAEHNREYRARRRERARATGESHETGAG